MSELMGRATSSGKGVARGVPLAEVRTSIGERIADRSNPGEMYLRANRCRFDYSFSVIGKVH